MNKKITVIELFNKIVNGEEVPKNIKVEGKEYCLDGSTYYTVGEDDEDLFCLESYTSTLDFLKSEVEILEDNTEEIEELDECEAREEIFTYTGEGERRNNLYCFSLYTESNIVPKINELVKVVNQIRKDLNK